MRIGRRQMLGATAGAAAALLAPPVFAAGEAVVRNTTRGPMRGRRLAAIHRFLGIPFATPPVGARRFLPPQPVQAWKGVLEANRYGPAPMQAPAQPSANVPNPPPASEDCLYLNLWAPADPGPHPVFVWIHGGGNVAGSSSMPVFDGSRFADDGIVCVSLTYRVGSFGFLELGELLGKAYEGSGNNGLRDLIAGLEWVHREIASFGGDPENVTIGGQSAGAKNVAALMAIPEARRLFQRVILQSGGGHTVASMAAARNLAVKILGECGLSVQTASELRTMPAAALVRAQQRVSATYPRKYPFRSVVDSTLLRQSPADAAGHKATRSMPMLIGTTRDENAFFGPSKTGDGKVSQQELANMSLADFESIVALYPKAFTNMSAEAIRYHALTAEEYWVPTLRLADAHAAAGGRTYLYRFDLAPSTGAFRGLSIHGSELPLVWDKLDDPLSSYLGPTGPTAVRLSQQIHEAWTTFIKGGSPSTGRLGWDPYDPVRRLTMRLDDQPRMVSDIDREGRLLWRDWKPAVYDAGA